MATKQIKICDCCKAEADEKSDDGRDYAIVKLDFKECYRIQMDYTRELCGLCSARLKIVVENKLKELRK